MSKLYLVLSTIDSKEVAEQIANHLLEERLAACVNIISDLTSIYRWKGVLERATESLMVIKSTEQRLPRLIERIKELHTYELPEVIALPIEDGLPPYLDWVVSETTE
jgi:periplasmic divalent cation tolerance protein